jgi:hypothetical protein
MADQTLLAKARKARFDDLPNFSGHPSEDVERFLKSIKNITKANDESDNHEIIEIVRGKLTQSAGLWFDNNEYTFKKWSDFETAFRNRYFSTTMIHKKFDQLKQRKQLYDEPVTGYIDDIINLCQDIDPKMSDPIIIQHLISGINPEFRKELSRRDSAMNTLNEFVKYAKIEQDLYDTFEKNRNQSLEPTQPYFNYNHSSAPPLTAMIKQQNSYSRDTRQDSRPFNTPPLQSSNYKRNSFYQSEKRPTSFPNNQTRNNARPPMFNDNQITHYTTSQRQFNNCKICDQRNHRTIDCRHKRATGCFNCGQNHIVRDCTMPPNFQ